MATNRTIIAVVLPEGYTSGSDFAKDCNVEVIGTCTEEIFKRAALATRADPEFCSFCGTKLPRVDLKQEPK